MIRYHLEVGRRPAYSTTVTSAEDSATARHHAKWCAEKDAQGNGYRGRARIVRTEEVTPSDEVTADDIIDDRDTVELTKDEIARILADSEPPPTVRIAS